MYRFLPAFLLLAPLAGCGVRAPVREATYGLLDAIQNPPPQDKLARDLRMLVQAYVERALAAGPPEDLGKLAGRITTGVLKATAATAPEERAVVGMMVSEVLRSSVAAMKQELPALERTGARLAQGAGDAGAKLVRGAMDASVEKLHREVDGAGEGPLAQALFTMAQRTPGATVRGATEGLRAELSTCQGGEGAGCGVDLVRSTSRSMVVGVLEGVRQEAGIWLLALALGLGVLVTGVTALIAFAARHRHGA